MYKSQDSFRARGTLEVGGRKYGIWRLEALKKAGLADPSRLPVSLRILLENLLRHEDGRTVRRQDIEEFAGWRPAKAAVSKTSSLADGLQSQRTSAGTDKEIAFTPARVLLQDFTGVPAIVDLAAMRDALVRMGGDPRKINPLCPADLVIDHSVQVDEFGSREAFGLNARLELERNVERYQFLRWGQRAFGNFRVVPPDTGIVHQVNLEYLACGVFSATEGGETLAFPDTLVGTDSHTTMINGLGVLGWGVGGIEAEAAMLGQPISMLIPEVVGVKLSGKLAAGATATDLVLTLTELLRMKGVVGKFVEFFGPGVEALTLPDRATLANMCPEYGATVGFFPVDHETLAYLKLTGRSDELIMLVEAYCKEQGLFRDPSREPEFNEVLALDLASVEPCLAGPKRPQDRVLLREAKQSFSGALPSMLKERLAAKAAAAQDVLEKGEAFPLDHGAVVIAAITSCTNTSNPAVMVAAGILAKKAVERGLHAKPWVKTSLAPGSKVVIDYLKETGLLSYLEKLNFHLVGYGCTTCIGNSGPLPEAVSRAIRGKDLVAAAVLSGNRNFEGRINSLVRANYLASPPLVVAYAIAGTMEIDLATEPLGEDRAGRAVYLHDIWPESEEIRAAMRAVRPEMFRRQYGNVFEGDAAWQSIEVPGGDTFAWDPKSTYVKHPPYLAKMPKEPPPLRDITGARVLVLLGDSVTTDHISPAGSIAKDSPAGQYLTGQGVDPKDFNSYGARRGNHEVMMRGTFANVRLKNLLLPGTEGGVTKHWPDGEMMSIYDAAMRYQGEKVPLLVIAGKEYGSGSSRDWAAKGPALLGVKAVLAESFERIHRSNLIGMGILPLEFEPGQSRESLGLTGGEVYEITGVARGLQPRKMLEVTARNGVNAKSFRLRCRIDTPVELAYYEHGGILPYVLRQLI